MVAHFRVCLSFFFFNDPATPEIYPLSQHDALPISSVEVATRSPASTLMGGKDSLFPPLTTVNRPRSATTTKTPLTTSRRTTFTLTAQMGPLQRDRKSTRLNSSHLVISYAVFCLQKK